LNVTKYGKKWRVLQITIRVKPEVGWNGPSLCGIESSYNGLSKINKIIVFENDKHFEIRKAYDIQR
jgi:hypothetical protein